MKECPFCAEEIQDDAVKCRYCREWINTSQASTGQHEEFQERQLCPDGACTGIIGPTGTCSECNRSPDEIRTNAQESTSKTPAVGIIEKELILLGRLRLSGLVIIVCFAISFVLGMGGLTPEGSQLPFMLLGLTFLVARIVFLVYAGKLASVFNESPILMVAGCLFIPIIMDLYAYFHFKGLVAQE